MLNSKFLIVFLSLLSSVTIDVSKDCALAQIIPDSTLAEENSIVTPSITVDNLPSDQIDGGAIRGTNLFHSFQQFNVGEGRGAYFINPAGIQNILSRVTGSSPSEILGRLGVKGDANLFLINPNGIIFGSDAQLDLTGSFIGSTASSLNFGDGTQFSATTPRTDSLLSLRVPLGLQYEGNPEKIVIQGNGRQVRSITNPTDNNAGDGLRVQPDQTLALVGGDVALEGGTLRTDGGRIELGSVGSLTGASLVNLIPNEGGFSLSYEGVSAFGSIQLSQRAGVDASGEGGGNIQVRGSQVKLTDGSRIESTTFGNRPGGTLSINASDSVEVIGTSADGELLSSLGTSVYPEATGTGGNLAIETAQLTVRDGAQLFTTSGGSGNAGSLTVKTSNSTALIGTSVDGLFASSIYSDVEPGATGTGGDITIDTRLLNVRDGAQLETDTNSRGTAGNLIINAADSVEVVGSVISEAGLAPTALYTLVGPTATGNGGNLTIETKQLSIRDGAQVFATNLGRGAAGSLTVRASDSVELIGTLPTFTRLGSALLTSVEPISTGKGSDLIVETPRFTVRDGAVVSTATFGEGDAGSLIVKASDLVELVGASADGQYASRLTSRTTSSNNAGSLKIGTRQLSVRDGAEVNVGSTGSGNAGDLQINADSVSLDQQAALSSETTSGKGDIFLRSQDLVLRRTSNITTNATGAASGGNINVNTEVIAALENSNITANAVQGQGGSVQISTQGLFLSPDSEITASSQQGIDGVVDIQTLGFDVRNTITPLQSAFVNPEQVVAGSCIARRNTEQGSFAVTGSGGLPISPSSRIEELNTLTGIEPVLAENTQKSPLQSVATSLKWKRGEPIVEAQGLTVTADGRKLLGQIPPQAQPEPIHSLVCRS